MNHCRNCNSDFKGNYCNNCGQKLFSSHDKSLKNLLNELLHFLTHFEGTFFTTLKNIFFYPSKVSIDYCNGIRKRYFKPFSLFLLVVLLYLLLPMASGLNMKMKYYKTSLLGKNLITTQIEKKAQQLNISENELAIQFEYKSEKVAKFLLLVLIPLTTLLLYFLFFKNKKLLYDTIIVSIEFNIFFISFYFLLLPALIFPFSFFITSLREIDENLFLVGLYMITFVVYTTVLFYKFYNQSKLVSFAKSLAFGFAYNFIVISIYKFLVFESTMLFL
jgi:hypothetical protein